MTDYTQEDIDRFRQAVIDAERKRGRKARAETLLAQLKAEQADLNKQLTLLQAVDTEITTTAWCADLTEDLAADAVVGTIESPNERSTSANNPGGVIIQPGYNSNATWAAARDGIIQPAIGGNPFGTFFNRSLAPGWSKWLPRYRIGTITAISGSLCSVTLDDDYWSDINLSVNVDNTLTNVPISYMTCNGAAFAVNDRVVVEFEQVQNTAGSGEGYLDPWEKPKVIGFEYEPKPCEVSFLLWPTDDTTTTNTASAMAYTDATGWYAHNSTPYVFGNVDWLGNDGTRLSFWGSPNRYHPRQIPAMDPDFSNFATLATYGTIYAERTGTPSQRRYLWRVDGATASASTVPLFDTKIYQTGAVLVDLADHITGAVTDARVFGCGIAVDPGDSTNRWLVVMTGDTHSGTHYVDTYTCRAAAITDLSSWSTLDTVTLSGTFSAPSGSLHKSGNVQPWLFRGDGLVAKTIQYDDTSTAAHYIYTCTVSFPTPGGTPTATIAQGADAWPNTGFTGPYGSPDYHAFDYIGNTEVWVQDDGTTITWEPSGDTVMTRGITSYPGSAWHIISCDLRYGIFFLEEDIYDSGGVITGYKWHVKQLDPSFIVEVT